MKMLWNYCSRVEKGDFNYESVNRNEQKGREGNPVKQ